MLFILASAAATSSKGPDYGSWADWVSGGGSLLAVFTALFLAFLEHRRARKADADRRVDELAREARVRGYLISVIRVLKEKSDATAAYLEDDTREDYAQQNRYKAWLDRVREADERLERLAQFPSVPLDLYLECDRVRASLAARNFPDRARQATAALVKELAGRLERSQQRLTGVITEANWSLDPETHPDT